MQKHEDWITIHVKVDHDLDGIDKWWKNMSKYNLKIVAVPIGVPDLETEEIYVGTAGPSGNPGSN